MSRDPTTWMWAEACEMLEKAERLHRRFFQLHRLAASRPAWEPPVDITETHDLLRITVVLPGVAEDTIEVAMVGNALVVSGARPVPIDSDTVAIHCLEIPYGRFERRIPLPEARFRLGKPAYANGCLTLSLHKTG
jgi:HSP20 family protein